MLQDLLPTLTVFPYTLVYSAILIASSGLALFAIRRAEAGRQNLMRSALLVIFVGQGVLLGANLLAAEGHSVFKQVFPLTHEVVSFISIFWMIWVLFMHTETSLNRWLPWVVTGGALLAGIAQAAAWLPHAGEAAFKGSWLDNTWVVTTLLTIIIGGVIYFAREPESRWEGGLVLIIAALGYMLYLALPNTGEMPAVIMASQLLYYPLLISLSWHLAALPRKEKTPQAHRTGTPLTLSAIQAASFLDVGLQSGQYQAQKSLAHSLGLYLIADLCGLLVRGDDSEKITLAAMYDLIREDYLKPISLQVSRLPEIRTHLESGEALVSNEPGSLHEVKNELMQAIGYNSLGNLLVYPFSKANVPEKYALVCLSPYTHREWSEDDLDHLEVIKPKLDQIMRHTAELDKSSLAAEKMNKSLLQAEHDLAQSAEEVSRGQELLGSLRQELDESREQHAAEVSVWVARQQELETRLEALMTTIAENQDAAARVERLHQENQALERTLAQNTAHLGSLKTALDQARELADALNAYPEAEHSPDLREALQASAQILAEKGRNRDITLDFKAGDLAEDIQAGDHPGPRVLALLLTNAIAATPTGGKVSAAAYAAARALVLEVTDGGPGLSQPQQAAFLELLADDRSLLPVGDRPALVEAVELSRQAGGHWWIHSEPDGSTTMKVTLPL